MMNDATLDRFFRDRRVGVLAIPRDGRPPLAHPVWYDYDGAVFRIQIEATSAKARAIARHGRSAPISLTVQSEAPPYRYAVVYGDARLGPSTDPKLRRRVARRYFGRFAGDQYVRQETADGRGETILRVLEITPTRVVSHDFRPEAGWFGRLYFALWRRLNPVPA
jgi:PPOX class probable F420-dependent enzyme